MKTYIAYKNDNGVKAFLREDDELVSVEEGKFEHWGKTWTHKTTFMAKGKINRVCADYNLGATEDNILIQD